MVGAQAGNGNHRHIGSQQKATATSALHAANAARTVPVQGQPTWPSSSSFLV